MGSVVFVVQKAFDLNSLASLGKPEDHHQCQKQGEHITATAIAEQFAVIAIVVVGRQVHCQKPQIGDSYKEMSFKNSL